MASTPMAAPADAPAQNGADGGLKYPAVTANMKTNKQRNRMKSSTLSRPSMRGTGLRDLAN